MTIKAWGVVVKSDEPCDCGWDWVKTPYGLLAYYAFHKSRSAARESAQKHRVHGRTARVVRVELPDPKEA